MKPVHDVNKFKVGDKKFAKYVKELYNPKLVEMPDHHNITGNDK